MQQETTYYVNLKNNADIRRSVLESSKGVVNTLQKFEKFRAIRSQKLQEIAKLRYTFREVQSLALQLRREMPQVQSPQARQQPQPSRAKVVRPRQVEAPRHGMDTGEVEKLEGELSKIESKLKALMG